MIGIILGTRPEIIKMSPVIRECEQRGIPFSLIHTGQHYSYEMDRAFFEQLELPEPDINLDVGSGTHAVQTGAILAGVESYLTGHPMDVVLVQGDTNTVLAGALAAVKLHVPVGHVEAGLRSFDRRMPEEINRIVADHISDYLFAPTQGAVAHLMNEGIAEEKVFMTGNTVVDALFQNREIARRKVNPLSTFNLEPGGYFLVTAHRAENVDEETRLKGIIDGLSRIGEEYDLPVLFPIHPRTRKMLSRFDIVHDRIRLVEPQGYLEFLDLMAGARMVLTDSGGVQEESCIIRVPCVTLRDNTERPETVEVGGNLLAGADPARIADACRLMMEKEATWENPFGDGKAAARIVERVAG
jgi:UDP-N-acetylglucosamine 2-epimerase (non-hydrolysing)